MSTALRFDLNTRKVLDDVTSDGRLFHVFAAATRKAQSPVVQSSVGGRVSAEVKDERQVGWRQSTDALVQ